MSIYRFIGIEADIGGYRKLNRFGQSIDLPDQLAKEVILGAGSAQGFAGAIALLPDEEFREIPFTQEELKFFTTPATQFGEKAAEFLEKKQSALEALHEYRLSLESPVANEETVHA